MIVNCLSRSRSVCRRFTVKQFQWKLLSTATLRLQSFHKTKIEQSAVARSILVVARASYASKPPPGQGEKWDPIYKFDNTKAAVTLVNMRILFTGFAVGIFTPICCWLLFNEMMSTQRFSIALAFVTVNVFVSHWLSFFTNRMILDIGISEDLSKIRILYLSTIGVRREVDIPIEDVVQLPETQNPNDSFVAIKRYSDPTFVLNLPMKSFTITDKEMFKNVFGKCLS